MSGHSKWNNIKNKKAKGDAARSKIFTKIGREIAVAVKAGGSDPSSNSKLYDIIQKAKANNMPNDNITRSIKKASGELSTVEIQDQQIYFVDKNDTTYCTNSIAQDLQLVNRLESAGVSFGKVYNQTTWVDTLLGWVISLLPMIILIVWFNRMMRKRVGEMTGGANSMIFGGGKSGAKQYVVEDGKSIKFADVAGEDEAKESLQERSKAKVPGEKSWTKNNCHIIINAKLQ